MELKSRYKILAAVFILISVFFVGLGVGLIIKQDGPVPIVIDKNAKIKLLNQPNLSEESQQDEFSKNYNSGNGNFVASINGKSYYPKDCPSAKRIKEENKIWFKNAEEAEAQGYKLAQNCS